MHALLHAAIAAAAALTTPLAPAQDTAAPETAWEILAVDAAGRPVPGVSLELVDTAPGAVAPQSLDGARRTDDDGLIAGTGAAPYVLDVVSRDPAWSVAFIHAERVVDETAIHPRLVTIDGRSA